MHNLGMYYYSSPPLAKSKRSCAGERGAICGPDTTLISMENFTLWCGIEIRCSSKDDTNGKARESKDSEKGFWIAAFAMKLTVFIFT